MMHYFNLEYHELGLALSTLGTRDFKQLFQTVHRYCIASANDPDAPIPTSDNEKINGFLFGMCTRIQAGAVAHERKSKVNRDNANKRWSKGGDHGGGDGGPEKSKVKAPITLKQFMKMAGRVAKPEGVEKLYHDLEAADWIYHGYQLSEEQFDRCSRCHSEYDGDGYLQCGIPELIRSNVVYNARALELFNAILDLGLKLEWDFCDATDTSDVRLSRTGIVFEDNGTKTEYDSIEDFIDALREKYKNK